MKTEDKGRKWMWWFLGSLLAVQFYFVIELLTLFAVFAVGFAALVLLAAAASVLYHGLAAGLTLAERQTAPAFAAVERGLAFAEELGRRPLRGPGDEPAQ